MSIFAGDGPLSALLKAPLNEPPIRTSPSCRSSSTRSCTGIGCRYTWKHWRSFRVTGRVRTSNSVNRNTCSFCKNSNRDSFRPKTKVKASSEGRECHCEEWESGAHRAALISQLPVAQQAPALLHERVLLPLFQVLQLLDVVLALRLSFLHIDVRQNTMDDGDLNA